MKTIRIIAPLLLMLFLISCAAPGSKEAYMEKFEQFVDDVKTDYRTYNAADWKEADEEFDRFTAEWYQKFEDDFTVSDKFIIKGLEARYYMLKVAGEAKEYFEEHLRDDYEEVREKVEYYIENDMEEDLDELMKIAKEAGDSAAIILKSIIDEFEENK